MLRIFTLVTILACMAATGSLYAADDRKAKTTQQTAPEQRSPTVKQSPRKPAKPASTFKPSERIGADSAVSFPVDI